MSLTMLCVLQLVGVLSTSYTILSWGAATSKSMAKSKRHFYMCAVGLVTLAVLLAISLFFVLTVLLIVSRVHAPRARNSTDI